MQTVTFTQIGIFFGCIIVVVGLAVAIKWLLPSPPLHKEYATRLDLARVEKDLKDDLTKGAVSRKEMHKQIEEIGKQQARLETQNEFQTQQLSALDGKIDRILERLPRR